MPAGNDNRDFGLHDRGAGRTASGSAPSVCRNDIIAPPQRERHRLWCDTHRPGSYRFRRARALISRRDPEAAPPLRLAVLHGRHSICPSLPRSPCSSIVEARAMRTEMSHVPSLSSRRLLSAAASRRRNRDHLCSGAGSEPPGQGLHAMRRREHGKRCLACRSACASSWSLSWCVPAPASSGPFAFASYACEIII